MTQRDALGSGSSRTPDSKLEIMITKSLHNNQRQDQRDGSSLEEAANTLDEEEDLNGSEPALMLRLYEAFRDRLFHFGADIEAEDIGISEEAIDEVLERQDIGDEILFSFLTLIHLELNHSNENLECTCPNQHDDNQNKVVKILSNRSHTPQLPKLTPIDTQILSAEQPQYSQRQSQASLLLSAQMEYQYQKELKEGTTSEEDQANQLSRSSNNNQQKNIQEKMMQSREADQMVVGVSYSQKWQQKPTPGQAATTQQQSGGNFGMVKSSNDYTPREKKADLKQLKNSGGSRTVKNNNNMKQKKDNSNLNSKQAKTASGGVVTDADMKQMSIENIPQIQGRRNNALSSSLQMLQNDPVSIDQRKKSTVNPTVQSSVIKASENKSYHLRYISQGLERSNTCVDSPNQVQKQQITNNNLNMKMSQQNSSAGSKLIQGSKERILVLPKNSNNERVTPQQYLAGLMEKRTIQQTAQNSRRIGGVSQNNLPSQRQNGMQNMGSVDSMMQRSLNVQSNHSSIVVEERTTKPVQLVPMGAMTFTASEYGPISLQEGVRASQQTPQEFENIKNSSQVVNFNGSIERKNVPLQVKQRTQQPNDYYLQNQDGSSNPTTILSGTNTTQTTNQATAANKNKNNPGMAEPQQYNSGIKPQGRGDKIMNRQQQISSNKSFQSAINNEQMSNSVSKQNIDRALKNNNIVNGKQRTRTAKIESSNVWEAPLSQKFDFQKPDALMTQTRFDQNMSQNAKEQLVLLQNMTPGQNRRPDFRQSTALPKTYQQFVATVNSGSLTGQQTQLTQQPLKMQPSQEVVTNMYKTTTNNFTQSTEFVKDQAPLATQQQQRKPAQKELYLQALQKSNAVGTQGSVNGMLQSATSTSKKMKKQRKDDVLKMINQLETGENSDNFKNIARQFYVQNTKNENSNGRSGSRRYLNLNTVAKQLQAEQHNLINSKQQQQQQEAIREYRLADRPTTQHLSSSMQSKQQQPLFNRNALQLTPGSQPQTAVDRLQDTHNPMQDNTVLAASALANSAIVKESNSSDITTMQKQLWQQFQLLRILKQNKYQHQLQKYANRGDSSHPNSGPPGSQALEYGFELTEEEMYARLFISKNKKGDKKPAQPQDQKDENQPYASFDCHECVQMASLLLEEELRYYMQRNHGKKGRGKSREALLRQNPTAGTMNKNHGQQHKGIAGLATQGVSLKNQRFMEENEISGGTQNMWNQSVNIPQDGFIKQTQQAKRLRAQTQQQKGAGVRNPSILDETQLVGQIFISRAQPQVFFKKQLNQSFRQVIRGEQMTQHMKQVTVGGQPTASTQLQSGSCSGAASKRNYEEGTPIPFQYGFQQRMSKQPKFNNFAAAGASSKTAGNGKASGGAAAMAAAGAGGHGHGAQLHSGNAATANHNEGDYSHQIAHKASAIAHNNFLDGTAQGFKRKYKPACGIYQPPLQPFKHLAQAPINQTLMKVNELVLILFKQKMKSSDQQIIKLLKYFGIPIPRGNGVMLDQKVLKMPDFMHAVNQKMMIKLYKVLNHENAEVKPEQSTQIFRFYVGKGNNYPSVRQIVSRRTWWNRGNQKQEKFYGQKAHDYEDEEQQLAKSQGAGAVVNPVTEDQILSSKQFSSGCHFIWTQWRKTEHHEFLKRVKDDKDKQKRNDAIMGRTNTSTPRKGAKKKPSMQFDPKMLVSAPLANVPTLIYNRLDDNYHLSNKKALFLNVSTYYQAMGINPFEVAIPLTFNVKSPHNNDPEYIKFTRAYKQFEQQTDANIWIIKPGENSNRGSGIQVASSFNEIRNLIQQLSSKNGNRTSIVQKYLDKPLLIHNRKFDIRGYALLTSINGVVKGYMYRDCYFRTSSKQFDLSNLHSRYIHLTNDAIQMNSEDYGRYESGNKLSINDFQRYLDLNHTTKNVCFMRDLFPQMERLVTDSFRAVGSKIDPKRISNCFEIFGYDFMIDENFKVFLIEANTNPCLEICSPLLARIIPELLDNSFRIAIDPLYQPSQFLAKLKDANGNEVQNNDKIESHRETNMTASCAAPLLKEKVAMLKDLDKGAEGDERAMMSPAGKKAKITENQLNQKRQRLELLTQIKYTLIYDERIDKPVVDKILQDYERKQKQQSQMIHNSNKNSPEGKVAQEGGDVKGRQSMEGRASAMGEREGAAAATTNPLITRQNSIDNDLNAGEQQLFREIVEEEKLDEQAAKKEEIEAAEDEEAGIMPQPLMLMPALGAHQSDDDEDEDQDMESEDEYFN